VLVAPAAPDRRPRAAPHRLGPLALAMTTMAPAPPTLNASAVAAHRFQMPAVHEVAAPQPRRPSGQREVVIASLVRCDRNDPPTHRRRP
jgi:hypothetical protein